MILYSIVPPEVVFDNYDKGGGQGYIEIEYLGEKVVVMPLTNNRYMIDRVISTSPKAFLNPKLMPGEVITGTF
ncbi:MAG: YlzJ-like family protein [Bacillota bacterium]